jgi:hypothetical protein
LQSAYTHTRALLTTAEQTQATVHKGSHATYRPPH